MKTKTKRQVLRAGVFAILIGAVALLLTSQIRKTIRLSATQIQAQMQQKFPIEKRELVFVARFSNPTVAIDASSGRVQLGMSTVISGLGMKPIAGMTICEGRMRYESAKGEFFLDSAKVTQQELVGVPDKYRGLATGLIEKGIPEYLARNSIYRLDTKDTNMGWIKRVLKSVRVESGEFVIELGL